MSGLTAKVGGGERRVMCERIDWATVESTSLRWRRSSIQCFLFAKVMSHDKERAAVRSGTMLWFPSRSTANAARPWQVSKAHDCRTTGRAYVGQHSH